MNRSGLLFLLRIWYNISLFYVTFFGLAKGVSEYFCQYESYGPVNYNQKISIYGFQSDEVVYPYSAYFINSHNGSLIGQRTALTRNFSCSNCSDPWENVFSYWVAEYYETSWVRGESKFTLFCLPNNGSETLTLTPSKFGGYEMESGMGIDFDGFLTQNSFTSTVYYKESSLMSCDIKKSDRVCTQPKKISDRYLLFYAIISGALFLVAVLTLLPIKRNLFLRWLCELHFYLKDMGIHNWFCNPVTRRQVWMERGDVLYKLGNIAEALEGLSDIFEDYKNVYEVRDNALYTKCKGSLKIDKICLEEVILIEIKKYFFLAGSNHRNCIMNNEETHYIDTNDVLKQLINGYKVQKNMKFESGFVLDVHEFELNYIMNNFQIKKAVSWMLLEHNWNFFKGKYNLHVIDKCLSGKLKYFHAPESVSSSQWKWYTSDYIQLMQKLQMLKPTGAKLWRPSWALTNTLLKDDVMQHHVVPLPEQIEVNHKVKFSDRGLIDTHESLVMNTLLENEPENVYDISSGVTTISSVNNDFERINKLNALFNKNLNSSNYKESLISNCKRVKNGLPDALVKTEANLKPLVKDYRPKFTYDPVITAECSKIHNSLIKIKRKASEESIKLWEDKLAEKKEEKELTKKLVSKKMDPAISAGLKSMVVEKCNQIIYFDEISNLLDEYEKSIEENLNSKVASVQHRIHKSTILNQCLNSKLQRNKLTKKPNKNKAVPSFKRRVKTTTKNCFKIGNFSVNLKIANKIGFDRFFIEKEKGVNLRSAHYIAHKIFNLNKRHEEPISPDSQHSYREFSNKRIKEHWLNLGLDINNIDGLLNFVENNTNVKLHQVRILLNL